MKCQLCDGKEQRNEEDYNELYTRDKVHYDEPLIICHRCYQARKFKELFCEDCYREWISHR